jgi:hypothetical protein
MTKTSVVHCKRDNCDVYIGRPSIWGNPFKIGVDGDRDEVIEKYRLWLLGKIEAPIEILRPSLEEIKKELKGKVLGCWCKPRSCHGDILAEFADSESKGELK